LQYILSLYIHTLSRSVPERYLNTKSRIDRASKIRKKVIASLNEEKVGFKERKEPEALLVLDLDLNGFATTIIQDRESADSIYLTMDIALPQDQIEEFISLDDNIKKDYILGLVNVFAGNCGLGGFELSPNGALDFRQIAVATKSIYYDGLTKERLFSSISDLIRAYTGIGSMLEYHTGIAGPAKHAVTTQPFYRQDLSFLSYYKHRARCVVQNTTSHAAK